MIKNPETGRYVSIYGKLGRSVLSNYLTVYGQSGGKPSTGKWEEVTGNAAVVNIGGLTGRTFAPCTNKTYDGRDADESNIMDRFKTKGNMREVLQTWHGEMLKKVIETRQILTRAGLNDKYLTKAIQYWATALDHYFQLKNSKNKPNKIAYAQNNVTKLHKYLGKFDVDIGVENGKFTNEHLRAEGISLRAEYDARKSEARKSEKYPSDEETKKGEVSDGDGRGGVQNP